MRLFKKPVRATPWTCEKCSKRISVRDAVFGWKDYGKQGAVVAYHPGHAECECFPNPFLARVAGTCGPAW